MMIAIEKGLLHIVPTPPDTNIDIIPVDYVVNGVLAAGWKTGLSRQGPKMLSKSSEGSGSACISFILGSCASLFYNENKIVGARLQLLLNLCTIARGWALKCIISAYNFVSK